MISSNTFCYLGCHIPLDRVQWRCLTGSTPHSRQGRQIIPVHLLRTEELLPRSRTMFDEKHTSSSIILGCTVFAIECVMFPTTEGDESLLRCNGRIES